MIRNYIKLAWRNLSRQKAFSIINISGLAIGLASSLTILLWLQDEISFDRFHEKSDRTYRITAAASNLQVAITPAALGPALQQAFPDLSVHTRVFPLKSVTLQAGDAKFEERSAYFAEPSFFDVFDFKLERGDVKTCLNDPNSMVISKQMAMKYFGTADALGKTLRKDDKDELKVTGVLSEPSANSHLKFQLLLPWSLHEQDSYNAKGDRWGSFDFYTYVVFNEPKDEAYIAGFNQQVDELFRKNESRVQVAFALQPVTDVHLGPQLMADVSGNGSLQYVTALGIIAIFIVLIGCINFMNLSTARSARRAKEVGLRKVAGAARTQLIGQFLGESVLITIIALVLASGIAMLALPVINDLVGKQLRLNFGDPLIIGSIAAIAVVTGVVAGIYPALILSGFKPVSVLKQQVKSGARGSMFRNVLVVSQFVISIGLLVGTAVVYQQLQFMREKDLGYDKENLLYMTIRGNVPSKINKWRTAFQANELTANVTISDNVPTNLVSGSADISWPGKDPAKQVMFATLFVDENFVSVYDMTVANGRNFYHELRGDSSNVMVNETAVRAMGFTNETAVGQRINTFDRTLEIVGVVKDFNFKPLHQVIEPMILRPNTFGGAVVVEALPGKTIETIAALEAAWNGLENVYPFSFKFIDQDLENLYRSEKQIGTLFTAFALLAIFISCLGLYGLSAFIAEQRTHEIGIRKALGASVTSIIYLLNTRFVIPVLVAMAIAAPLAWYAMSRWLDGFAYKVSFHWGIVAGAGALALLISFVTVSYESVKAARVNPVKSLRSE